MKDLGCIRKIDSLGRINLPIDIIRTLGIDTMTQLEVFTQNNEVHIKKLEKKEYEDIGFLKYIGSTGRLGIPYDIREQLGIYKGTKLHMYLQDRVLILEKEVDSCNCCGEREQLYTVNKLSICRKCGLNIASHFLL